MVVSRRIHLRKNETTLLRWNTLESTLHDYLYCNISPFLHTEDTTWWDGCFSIYTNHCILHLRKYDVLEMGNSLYLSVFFAVCSGWCDQGGTSYRLSGSVWHWTSREGKRQFQFSHHLLALKIIYSRILFPLLSWSHWDNNMTVGCGWRSLEAPLQWWG